MLTYLIDDSTWSSLRAVGTIGDNDETPFQNWTIPLVTEEIFRVAINLYDWFYSKPLAIIWLNISNWISKPQVWVFPDITTSNIVILSFQV